MMVALLRRIFPKRVTYAARSRSLKRLRGWSLEPPPPPPTHTRLVIPDSYTWLLVVIPSYGWLLVVICLVISGYTWLCLVMDTWLLVVMPGFGWLWMVTPDWP